MKRNWAAALMAAAFVLSACGAQPANLPTVTPQPLATATGVASAVTSTDTPAPTQAANTTAQAMTPQAAGDRPYAQMSPAQRSKIGSAPPPMAIDVTKKYVATIHTAKGDIKVELDPSAAPQTVNNFVYLSQNGFYDGLVFHRVEANFVIQGGDPLGNGTGGPGYTLPPEIKLNHVDGAIAMARTSGPPESTPNSGSQFYITIGAQPNLDQQYTVFGKTIGGLDVVRKIAVGDAIQRIDITTESGASVAPPPVVAAPPVTCQASPLNVAKDDHVQGAANAPVTIVEYADVQCPACGQLYPSLKSTVNLVSDTVQLVFRHFPLTTIHDKAQITAQALEAASLQNKFWEMHDLLYEKQDEWSSKPVTGFETVLGAYAKGLGMDAAKFQQDLSSQPVKDRVARDVKDAESMQLNATPSMFLNGRPIQPDAFMQTGTTMADQLRAYAQQRAQVTKGVPAATMAFAKPDQVTQSGALYEVTIKTNKGDVQLELDPKLAPVNVNSTVFLAQKNYFDNTPIEQSNDQLGAVLFDSTSRQGNPGYNCGIEQPAPNSYTKPGVVALLNDGVNNTTQLIVTYSATQQLESQYTVIGHVTSGLDIVKSMQAGSGTTPSDKILSTTVTKK